MKKKSFVYVCAIFLSVLSAFSEELTYIRPQTTGLDIELSQVKLIVSLFDGEAIAYHYELREGKKLSFVETQKTLRIRQLMPAEGTVYLYIPKTMVLENCSIRSNRADIGLESVQAVHLLLMMNVGSVHITDCRFKNTVINLARGSLVMNKTEVIRSAAIAVSDASADIVLPSKESEYHIDYVHNGGALTIESKEYTKSPGEYGNPRARRRIVFSGGSSAAAIRFTEQKPQTP